MNDFLHEWKNVTLGVMSNDLPTVIEALEGSVVRAETKANVVDFREAADWYHGDNPDYQLARLRRIRQYLRDERIWEADRQRWLSLTMAEGIVLGVIQRNFGEDE